MNLAKRMECAVSRRFGLFYFEVSISNENREKRGDTAHSTSETLKQKFEVRSSD